MKTVQEHLTKADTITHVINNLITTPVAQMVQYRNSGDVLKFMIDSLESDNSKVVRDYVDGSIFKLNFIEMLALMREIKGDDRYEFGYSEKKYLDRWKRISCTENYYNHINILLTFFMLCTREKSNLNEYMFGRFRLEDLYMYDSALPTGRGRYENRLIYNCLQEAYYRHMKRYGALYKASERNKLSPEITVRSFLEHCFYMIHTTWGPGWCDPDMYIESIKSAHSVTGILLVDYFTSKYEDRYDIDSLRSKVLKEEPDIDDWEYDGEGFLQYDMDEEEGIFGSTAG